MGREWWNAVKFGRQVNRLDNPNPTPGHAPISDEDFLRGAGTQADWYRAAETDLHEANARLSAGDTDAAVQLAFHRVRDRLEEELAVPEGLTPGEFLQRCQEVDQEDSLDELRDLTACYERAVFDIPPIDHGGATRAIESARRILARWPATEEGDGVSEEDT